MSAVITTVLIGAGLLALAIWVEIREGPAAPGDGDHRGLREVIMLTGSALAALKQKISISQENEM